MASIDLANENAALKARILELQEELRSLRCGNPSVTAEPTSSPVLPASNGRATAWTAENHGLTKQQVERYSRHLLLPSVGLAAQQRLCQGSVLIVGCGGLGCPAALYLAAAGVGHIGLVDHDVVDTSNLHRQVIHTEARVGVHKAQSAALSLAALNSGVRVTTHCQGLNPSNACAVIQGYDLVLDASDNPPTRYLISDACVACRKPLVSAAAVGTDGQLTVYCYGEEGPCYRCLFPECPAAASCSRCADAGVLGPVPGVMGVLQALEVLKVLGGIGEVLARKMLVFDALAGRFSSVKLRGRRPNCLVCGSSSGWDQAAVAAYDYFAFTGQRPSDGPPPPANLIPDSQRLRPEELQSALGAATCPQEDEGACNDGERAPVPILDVRPAPQFALMRLPGSVNIPFTKLASRISEAATLAAQAAAAAKAGTKLRATTKPESMSGRLVVVCRRGNDSQRATLLLREHGVSNVIDVIGGLERWAQTVQPGMPVL